MKNIKSNSLVNELKRMLVESEIEEKMLKKREIFLWGDINDESAENVVKKILYYNAQSDEDITLYINSPGGMISSGLAIYDAMKNSKSDIKTICMGLAASMGAIVLCAGTKGKRQSWENARVMIHQPLIAGNFFGPASEIKIQAEEMIKVRDRLNKILSEHTGQPIKKIEEDTDRDFFMSAEEAQKYGIIDEVIKK
jgi:ATP-dependent Clp protease protease subunit